MVKPKYKNKKNESNTEINGHSLSVENKKGENIVNNVHLSNFVSKSVGGGSLNNSNTSNCVISDKTTHSINTSWYVSEIQAMMHGFGDSTKPMTESAQLIEKVVYQQMSLLLVQVNEVATARNSKAIGIEDLLFMLRKNPVKLSRLYAYIVVRDAKQTGNKYSAPDNEDESEIIEGKNAKKGLKKVVQEFISSIDQTGELCSVFNGEVYDSVKHERNLRADRMTRSMSPENYVAFCEARRTSFTRKYRYNKFRDWLLRSNVTDLKLSPVTVEILNYFAYETVAQIVDLCLLFKTDSVPTDNPIDRLTTYRTLNKNYPQVIFHQQAGSSQSLMQQNDSNYSSLGSPQPVSPNSSLNPSMVNKTKKRKRAGAMSSIEIPKTYTILPCDVREVVSRYMSSTGPFSYFSKNSVDHNDKRLFCL